MSRKRKICYITGTRADFGLMESTLTEINSHSSLELSLVVTGTHFSSRYGRTVTDIEQSGLGIAETIELNYDEDPSGASMAKKIGYILHALVDVLERTKPDIVLVLGDRGEMLAAALAAIHLNIPIAHIHGGERSGTVDEPVRHAISKLAHLHFVATRSSSDRLVRMGERADCVWLTGAPGLDGLTDLASISRETLFAGVGFDLQKKSALLVYHPILQNTLSLEAETRLIFDALHDGEYQVVALLPNSDAGSECISRVLTEKSEVEGVHLVTHLSRREFVSWMAASDVMVGNSSSGIIESATFGTPVINIGSRQNLRERNSNVIDVMPEFVEIKNALAFVLEQGRLSLSNVYGDGCAAERIVSILSEPKLPSNLLFKANVY